MDEEKTTAAAAPDYGEYGDVIATMKQFVDFIVKLITQIKEAFEKLFKKNEG